MPVRTWLTMAAAAMVMLGGASTATYGQSQRAGGEAIIVAQGQEPENAERIEHLVDRVMEAHPDVSREEARDRVRRWIKKRRMVQNIRGQHPDLTKEEIREIMADRRGAGDARENPAARPSGQSGRDTHTEIQQLDTKEERREAIQEQHPNATNDQIKDKIQHRREVKQNRTVNRKEHVQRSKDLAQKRGANDKKKR